MQIREGEQRVLSTSRNVVDRSESASRAHPPCFLEAITQHGSRISRRFYELALGDRAALREEIRQIIHPRSVRSPPFLLFRLPTLSPVEICMHGWVWLAHALGTCLQIRIACEHVRASMRNGPYSSCVRLRTPWRASARAHARAHARASVLDRAPQTCYCVRTQPSMPQELVRTGAHARACTQVADSAGGGADSGLEAEPIERGGDEGFVDSDPEDVPIVAEWWCDNVNPQEATTSAIDLRPIQPGHIRYNDITMPLPDLHDIGMLAHRFDWGFESDAVSPHRLCEAVIKPSCSVYCHIMLQVLVCSVSNFSRVGQQPPSKEIRHRMVRLVLPAAAQRRSLRPVRARFSHAALLVEPLVHPAHASAGQPLSLPHVSRLVGATKRASARTGTHTRACAQEDADDEDDNGGADTDDSDDVPFVWNACTNNTPTLRSMATTPARALPVAPAGSTSPRPPPRTPSGRECTAVTPSSSNRPRRGSRADTARTFFIIAPGEVIRTAMQDGVVWVVDRRLEYTAGAGLMFVEEDLLQPITSLVVCGFGKVESNSTSDSWCKLHFSLQTSLTCEPFGPGKIWECCQDKITHTNFASVVGDLLGSTPDKRSDNSGMVVTDNHVPMVMAVRAAMVASSGGASAHDQPTTCTIRPVMSMEETPLDKIVDSRKRVPRRKQARRSRARPHLPTRKAGLFHLRSRLNARDGQLTTVQAKRSRDADREDADEEADSDGEGQADSDGEGRTHLRKRLSFARSECEVREATRSDGRTALCAHWHGAHWHGAHWHGAHWHSAEQRAFAGRGARAGAPRRTPLPTRRW